MPRKASRWLSPHKAANVAQMGARVAYWLCCQGGARDGIEWQHRHPETGR